MRRKIITSDVFGNICLTTVVNNGARPVLSNSSYIVTEEALGIFIMALSSRIVEPESLVVCLCRYCKGKKVSRYVRRQHNQRYQYQIPREPSHSTSLVLQEQDEVLNAEGQQFAPGISESPPTHAHHKTLEELYGPVKADVGLDLSHDVVQYSDDDDHEKILGSYIIFGCHIATCVCLMIQMTTTRMILCVIQLRN